MSNQDACAASRPSSPDTVFQTGSLLDDRLVKLTSVTQNILDKLIPDQVETGPGSLDNSPQPKNVIARYNLEFADTVARITNKLEMLLDSIE